MPHQYMILEVVIVGFLLIAAGLMVMVPDDEAPIPWIKAKLKGLGMGDALQKAKKSRRRKKSALRVVKDLEK